MNDHVKGTRSTLELTSGSIATVLMSSASPCAWPKPLRRAAYTSRGTIWKLEPKKGPRFLTMNHALATNINDLMHVTHHGRR
jgi:hypothetical protein